VANGTGNIFFLLRNSLLLLVAVISCHALQAQDTLSPAKKIVDTVRHPATIVTDTIKAAPRKDSPVIHLNAPFANHSPRKATLYAAVLPGLGQYYNREYWKIPLVYAALGTCTYFFITNLDQYTTYRDAYRLRMDGNPDTHDQFEDIYKNPQSLKILRDGYREYVDYSVLFFVLAYGLNIVDATVFAHLKQFDMSNDLSMRITPTIINNQAIGIGIHLQLGKQRKSKQSWAYTLK
jgi:hypothetical protein